jgi:hypothetical protein
LSTHLRLGLPSGLLPDRQFSGLGTIAQKKYLKESWHTAFPVVHININQMRNITGYFYTDSNTVIRIYVFNEG